MCVERHRLRSSSNTRPVGSNRDGVYCHACKMRHGALVGMIGILIFDKRAFAVEMFEFGAFFLNQVRLAGLKVGCMNELERSHVSDAYCMDTLDFNSIFYEFLSRCAFAHIMDYSL